MAKRKEEEMTELELPTEPMQLTERDFAIGDKRISPLGDIPPANSHTLARLHELSEAVQVKVLRKAYPNAKYFGKLKDKEEKNRAGENHPHWRPGRVYPILEIMYRPNDDPRCILLDITNGIQYLLADEFEFVPEAE